MDPSFGLLAPVSAAAKAAKSRKRHPALPYRHPRRTREEHSHETAQDYVEIIAELIAATGEARVIDLARRLGVTHVTVARTIQRLQREGLVTSRPYRSIFLTSSGSKLSEESRTRHEVVVEFLKSLGVPTFVAESDAEGIEHHVSEETLRAFVKALRKRKRRKPAR
ncbi:MAG: manganese-binding transcriptional regulator MntR [Chthoniobacterales bacterium]